MESASARPWSEPCETLPDVRRSRRVTRFVVAQKNLENAKICEENIRGGWDTYEGTYRWTPESSYFSIFNSKESVRINKDLMKGRPLYQRVNDAGNATGHYLQYIQQTDNINFDRGSWVFFFQENRNSYRDFLVRPNRKQSTFTPLDLGESTLFAVNNSVVIIVMFCCLFRNKFFAYLFWKVKTSDGRRNNSDSHESNFQDPREVLNLSFSWINCGLNEGDVLDAQSRPRVTFQEVQKKGWTTCHLPFL